MVLNKDAGLLGGLRAALAFERLAFFDHHLDRTAAIHIGAGIEGIVQDIADKADAWQLPHQLKLTTERLVDRQFDLRSRETSDGFGGYCPAPGIS